MKTVMRLEVASILLVILSGCSKVIVNPQAECPYTMANHCDFQVMVQYEFPGSAPHTEPIILVLHSSETRQTKIQD